MEAPSKPPQGEATDRLREAAERLPLLKVLEVEVVFIEYLVISIIFNFLLGELGVLRELGALGALRPQADWEPPLGEVWWGLLLGEVWWGPPSSGLGASPWGGLEGAWFGGFFGF